jgi:hypothetical protein
MCERRFFIVSVVLVLGLALGVARADLVAWYQFEGNADDSAGSNHGSLMGDAAFAPGLAPLGQALSLDGDGDYVGLPNDFASVTSSPTKSIMAWVKSDQGDNAGKVLTLYRKSDGSSGFGIRGTIYSPSEWIGLYMSSPSTSSVLDSNTNVTVGQWAHVALVQDMNEVFIYINGELANSASDADIPNISNPLNAIIGAYNSGTYIDGSFNGLIDDVRIYDNALSESDIRAIMPEPATVVLLGLGAILLKRKSCVRYAA